MEAKKNSSFSAGCGDQTQSQTDPVVSNRCQLPVHLSDSQPCQGAWWWPQVLTKYWTEDVPEGAASL